LLGGQSSQKTQIARAVGRAALGASTLRQPSRVRFVGELEEVMARSLSRWVGDTFAGPDAFGGHLLVELEALAGAASLGAGLPSAGRAIAAGYWGGPG
jgi:hypothetical protein